MVKEKIDKNFVKCEMLNYSSAITNNTFTEFRFKSVMEKAKSNVIH